ncbi:hypothetical protein Vretimale_19853 [Volvox reticuliferus]|uniref:Uncharacterized protein n=1 Tax=Volvox reticuliferus TaxID=1737510 RepID=A0A8J4M0N4_9CHLO|nr:hypothetical protein Vretimale_19853 [Volvox reticuliferus]
MCRLSRNVLAHAKPWDQESDIPVDVGVIEALPRVLGQSLFEFNEVIVDALRVLSRPTMAVATVEIHAQLSGSGGSSIEDLTDDEGSSDGSSGAQRDGSSGAQRDSISGAQRDSSSGAQRDGSSGAQRDSSSGARRDSSSGARRGGSSGAQHEGSSGARRGGSSGARRGGSSGARRDSSSGAQHDSSSGAQRDGSSGAQRDSSSGARRDSSSGARRGGSSGVMAMPDQCPPVCPGLAAGCGQHGPLVNTTGRHRVWGQGGLRAATLAPRLHVQHSLFAPSAAKGLRLPW